jgi:hypothetical protein
VITDEAALAEATVDLFVRNAGTDEWVHRQSGMLRA